MVKFIIGFVFGLALTWGVLHQTQAQALVSRASEGVASAKASAAKVQKVSNAVQGALAEEPNHKK